MNQEKLHRLLHQGVDRQCASLPLDPDRVEKVLRAADEDDRRHRLSPLRRPGTVLRGWRMPIVAAMVLLVLFAGLFLPRGWLLTRQCDGDEQYLRSGQDLHNSQQALAAPGVEYGVYAPATWEEVLGLFGVPPLAPRWLPEGWQVETYNVSLLGTIADLTIVYVSADGDARLIYQYTQYADYASIHQYIEQDGEGITRTTSDGRQIYLTSNAGRQTASWHSGTTTCLLSGDVTQEELFQIAESVR